MRLEPPPCAAGASGVPSLTENCLLQCLLSLLAASPRWGARQQPSPDEVASRDNKHSRRQHPIGEGHPIEGGHAPAPAATERRF